MCLIVLLLCASTLSSCGDKEFKFDDAITWNSTIDDIKTKYGSDYSEKEYQWPVGGGVFEPSTRIVYKVFNCCGYDDFSVSFYTSNQNKDTVAISVFGGGSTEKKNTDIKNALISKYGNPSDTTDNYSNVDGLYALEWFSAAKDTRILFTYGEGKTTRIDYRNIKYNTQSAGMIEMDRKSREPQTNGI